MSIAGQLLFFFCNDRAPTEIYTLSLHDALPICRKSPGCRPPVGHGGGGLHTGPERPPSRPPAAGRPGQGRAGFLGPGPRDRKSTRLNSSHVEISYAVFCLKKKRCMTLSFSTYLA